MDTLLTNGPQVPVQLMTLRETQKSFYLGTPPRNDQEHEDNCTLNQWHAMFRGVDAEGKTLQGDRAEYRELLASEIPVKDGAVADPSVEVAHKLDAFMQAANVKSDEEANRLKLEALSLAGNKRNVVDTVVSTKNLLEFLINPRIKDKKDRAGTGQFRKEFLKMLSYARNLPGVQIELDRLWEDSGHGTKIQDMNTDNRDRMWKLFFLLCTMA